MAYLKPYYHIEEVVEIFQQRDPMVTRESVLDLGARGLLNFGLLSLPFTRGNTDLWNERLAKQQGYEIRVIGEPYYESKYPAVARRLYNGLKKQLEYHKKHSNENYESVKDGNEYLTKYLLETYRLTAPIVKKYRFHYPPVLLWDKEQEKHDDTNYEPLIDEIGLKGKPERLIFPVFEWFAPNWILKVLHGDIEYLKRLKISKFTDLNNDVLKPIKGVIVNLPCDELPDELQYESDTELCNVELIYQHELDTDYFIRLIEADRFYISRRELMCFEQEYLGIEHRMKVNTPKQNTTNVFSSPPRKKDDLFNAMNTVFAAFLSDNGRLPQRVEAWEYFKINLPSYLSLNEKQNAILLDGKEIDKEAFLKRLKRYTKEPIPPSSSQ
ncbi:hypothetical protein [Thiomicrorhabdus xiamenensis]|uniref:Uncharacterized protein n=1 Tax=Thiomicrorhabdus xiamenensis TaxID=2739063 RepID=A0A7D4SN79_9GAMM|nr:hypothetical protein [Thiomicrorhabdus xiamenensis]QKI89221.1 hypothetical protein HQN79_06410 [Thiomicrorhabdus xiamenensis]